MANKKRKLTAGGVHAAFLGLVCAALLAALFYGVMVYQLAGEQKAAIQQEAAGGVLSLSMLSAQPCAMLLCGGFLAGELRTRHRSVSVLLMLLGMAAAGAVLADVWLEDHKMPVVDSLGDEFLDYVKDGMNIIIQEGGKVMVSDPF